MDKEERDRTRGSSIRASLIKWKRYYERRSGGFVWVRKSKWRSDGFGESGSSDRIFICVRSGDDRDKSVHTRDGRSQPVQKRRCLQTVATADATL
ncbi:hypothetical protein MA16_Dca002708 [Dendrobium catenatum]|uniref:Uncharacterized protein n=1 Tax=Dendrobium catenatum TaxID=906689 RepID=A0A2I0X8H5_9ASPA|nr:hypothetical protein MA16_Dca002708 [Dendrobium catenatum]